LFGLEKAKKQILRYIAAYNQNPYAQIRPLLLIGPAGVGKTVFGRIIAKVLGKSLKVISMPSISAGWQFTGTEKGWGNACCGIIVESIIKNGELPVFLIDEVDKAAKHSFAYSSPQQGLLNLLDDSRDSFTDVFLEVPINLNNAFFILTANNLYDCDEFMVNRCMKVKIEGYNDPSERRIILADYIIPKLLKEYKLEKSELVLSDEVLDLIVSESSDPNGGLRIMQKQAENVVLEYLYQKHTNENSTLTVETVKKVLHELSKTESELSVRVGFGR
jgi:ATP-dependent Lon protease